MDKIKKNFQKYIEKGICTGAEWKINYKDNIYHDFTGYRDLQKKEKLSKNLTYRIWSMTKPIVSFAAMRLIEKNYLHLDDTIDKFLPYFKEVKILNDTKNINNFYVSNTIPTIKQLLLHTAGFTYNSNNNIVAEEYEKRKIFHSGTSSLEEEVKNISSIPLLFEPGNNWHYSVSIDILARILEVITKEKLIDILEENVFSPLEMKDTSFYINKNNNHNLVPTYEYSKEDLILKDLSPVARKLINYSYPYNNKNFARGGHGLFSTANDYSKFSQMLINGKNTKGKKIISLETLDKMRTNYINLNLLPLEITSFNTIKDENYINDLEGYGWGLGFRVLMNRTKKNPHGNIGEFGWSGYASTYFMIDPSNQLSAVLMMQIIDSDRILKQDFYDSIYKSIEEI